ncbi:ABC transporter permease [Terrarubrum flagellatum]|uniref:ABC transporter permease n=1 Tax=Terrirubrum flagellatum TaxID=2895980 RepID=UPI003144D3E6
MSVAAADSLGAPASRGRVPLATIFRIALRDLRAGLSGFRVCIACLALGVAAITAIGALSTSLVGGMAREGRTILGGDAAFFLVNRDITPDERARLEKLGSLSVATSARAMLRAPTGDATLVELKAVDSNYPAVGELKTEPPLGRDALKRNADGSFGVVADPLVLARLNLKVGDSAEFGVARVTIAATLVEEPDKLATGVGFGPRLLASQQALDAAGLIQPGSLFRQIYRVQAQPPLDDAALNAALDGVKRDLPQAGWEIRSRTNASPNIGRNIDRFSQFLAIVGLTALVVGGVGIANAVKAFIDARQESFAILKAVGASGRAVFGLALVEVLAMATIGIAIGVAIGLVAPYLVAWLGGDLLPIPIDPTPSLRDAGLGVLYGYVTTLAFALWPLGKAHDTPVAALFRDRVDPARKWPRWSYVIAMVLSVAALAAVAIGFAWERRAAAITVAAVAGVFLLLRIVATLIMAAAARLPRPRRTEWRLALANIHRPGSLTPSLVLSLGLGVSLLVAITEIDGNLRRELSRNIPQRAPSFFFLDIPNSDAKRFDAALAEAAPGAKADRVPMMRGRIVSLAGRRAEDIKAPDQISWVLEGDRGVTYSAVPPENSRVVEGEWWAPDHRGSNLVSFDAEIAKGLNVKIGDKVVVNVLGRDIEATVANLRKIEWRSLGINFVMVFSPNIFAGAPHTHLATVAYDHPPEAAEEAALIRKLAVAFPAVTSVRVRDAIEAFDKIVKQLGLAIRGASAIAILSSLLVLAGALAAGQRARQYDAVILKTLGATRGRLLLAFVAEYGALGVLVSLFGIIAGSIAAWLVTTRLMQLEFTFELLGAILTAFLAIGVTIILGLAGTWRLLGENIAAKLRTL